MFKDPIECYEKIAGELVRAVNDNWDSIEVEAKITGESSIDIEVIYVNKRGEHGVYDVLLVPRYFFELSKLVSTKDKGLYKTCTFYLYSDGRYDVKFTY